MSTGSALIAPSGGIAGVSVPDLAVEDLRIVRRSHPLRKLSAVLALAVLGAIVWSFVNNPNVRMDIVLQYLTAPMILKGVLVTLYLTAISMVLGVSGGVVIAIMRLSDNVVLSSIARLYIGLFRGTPILVQLIFWAYAGAIWPTIGLPVPFTDTMLWSAQTSDLVTPMIAALLGLTFNQVAYAAEIIRAGILSVDHGQTEAASSLGMSSGRTMRRIVLPQAMRTIIPPMGNDLITMLKTTSLVSVIGGMDLMTTVQFIYSENFQVIPLLLVASLWYLFFTTLLAVPQRWLEQRYGRGVARTRRH